jgi:MscS family membrane protein
VETSNYGRGICFLPNGNEQRIGDWRVTLTTCLHPGRLRICRRALLFTLISAVIWTSKTNAQQPAQQPLRGKVAAANSSTAQPSPAPAVAATPAPAPPAPPPEPLGRLSPHGTVLGFLRAAEAKDYERAAQYLDGKRSPEQAQALAIQLKYLLDKGLSTSIDNLSSEPSGDVEDNLRLSRELVGVVPTPNGDLKVFLDLINRPGQSSIWLFSQDTLSHVPEAFAGIHHTDYESWFPAWASRIKIFSVPLWRWASILISLFVIFLLASLLTRSILWLVRHLFKKHLSAAVEEAILGLKLPLFIFSWALIGNTMGAYAITVLGRHYWQSLSVIVGWIGFAWLLVRISDIFATYTRQRLLVQARVERATFVNLIGRLFKIFVLLVLVIALLSRAGVNISALITGLGIGGVALALAAQKTLSDLFGGLSIIMRGAVRVGDVCTIDGISGIVEDVGISSLSLRTFQRSLVSIPNTKVAEVNLENLSLRDQFRIYQIFTLRFDTPSEVLKTVLGKFGEILRAQPDIDANTARVALIGITPQGPQIEINAYLRRPGADIMLSLKQQQDLLLQMISVIDAAGTSMAAPVGYLRLDAAKDSEGPDHPSNGLPTTTKRKVPKDVPGPPIST